MQTLPIYTRDWESEDILKSGNLEWLQDSKFTCGWRGDKLCRGWSDKVDAAIAVI